MARQPKLDQGTEAWNALEADWCGSTMSLRELARKHEISESTIRGLMAGKVREAGATKRALIRAAAAGSASVEARIDATVRAEADQDIQVQGIAAANAKGIMDEVKAALARISAAPKDGETAAEALERIHLRSPRSLLQLSQANAHALEAWRRARELDEPQGGEDAAQTLLQHIAARGSRFAPAADGSA